MINKILYIHGLSSSGSSSNAGILRKLLTNIEVISPDLSILPTQALEMLRNLCLREKPDIVICTSMGGMFA